MQVYIDECLSGISIYSSGSTSAHSLFIEPENVCIDDARSKRGCFWQRCVHKTPTGAPLALNRFAHHGPAPCNEDNEDVPHISYIEGLTVYI